MEARGGYEIGDTKYTWLDVPDVTQPKHCQNPCGAPETFWLHCHCYAERRGAFVMEMEMASQGAPPRHFWVRPPQKLDLSYSHRRTLETCRWVRCRCSHRGQRRASQQVDRKGGHKRGRSPPHPQNGSVVHCSPQLEDLKQPTGEGSRLTGSRVHILETTFSPVSPASVSIHRQLPFCQQDRTERAGQHTPTQTIRYSKKTFVRCVQNSANSTTDPKLAQHPQGLRDSFHGSVPPCHTTTWIEIGYQDPGNPRRANLISCACVARSRNRERTMTG